MALREACLGRINPSEEPLRSHASARYRRDASGASETHRNCVIVITLTWSIHEWIIWIGKSREAHPVSCTGRQHFCLRIRPLDKSSVADKPRSRRQSWRSRYDIEAAMTGKMRDDPVWRFDTERS